MGRTIVITPASFRQLPMSRSNRLFLLLQVLRTLPAPVTAQQLANETGVSLRSVYRDIDSLRASGTDIAGERGHGYTLIDDGMLRPQTFSRIEIEALTLGMAEVMQMGDHALASAAHAVLAKVKATLPSLSQQHLLHAVSQVHRFNTRFVTLPNMQLIRDACWHERALVICYTDRNDAETTRTIWPLAIIYLERMLVVLARCCMREEFRMFRAERITSIESTEQSFRPRRAALLRSYLAVLNQAG